MDGASRVTVVSSLSHPWGLTIYQNYLYYTDLDYEVIERVEKDTGTNMVVMRSGMSGLHGLKVHARDSMWIKCLSNNYRSVRSLGFWCSHADWLDYITINTSQWLREWYLGLILFLFLNLAFCVLLITFSCFSQKVNDLSFWEISLVCAY